MKRMKFMLYAVAAIATVSCIKEVAPEASSDAVLVPMTFSASSEDADTKVVLQSDKKTMHWASTDQIKVFDGISNELPAFTTTESGASVTFAGQISDGATGPFYALYPYQESATYAESAQNEKNGYGMVIKANVPAVQTAVANGIAPEAYIAAAKSDDKDNFYFKPLLGFVKFQLSAEDAANAVAVSLSGNDFGSLTGNIEIFFQQKKNDETVEAFGQTYISNQMSDYVTLKGTFAADTDYYFAIRSNAFATGFTMTILYADGSCKHVTTTKAAPQTVSRGIVMNIGKPAFTEGAPANPYIAWQHGASIEIAGVKYSKETNGAATLVSKAGNISTDGVYFINPGFTATVNKNLSSVILIGTDATNRATVTVSKAFKPAGSSPMAIANANVTYSNTNQLFQLTANTDKICFENSSFNNIQHTFINGGNDYKADVISIKDCEIQLVGSNNGSAYMYYSKCAADQASLSIVNCIFYYRLAAGKIGLTDFKLCQYATNAIKDINITRNTFDCTIIPNAGLVKVKKISGTVNINNNLFHDVVAASAHSNILGLDTKTGEVLPTGGDITNNFFYKSDSDIEKNLIINRDGLSALTKLGSPQPTLADVLAKSWDPANNSFGIAAEIQYVNSNSETITVSTENIGAHR